MRAEDDGLEVPQELPGHVVSTDLQQWCAIFFTSFVIIFAVGASVSWIAWITWQRIKMYLLNKRKRNS